MYCFKIEPTVNYSGGCAIVAAHTPDEAIKEYCKSEYNDWIYDEHDCTCNIVQGLEYDTDTPKVVINEIYIE